MNLARNICYRNIQRLDFDRINFNAYFPVHTANAGEFSYALHRKQLLGNIVIHEPGQILFIQMLGCNAESDNRPARCIYLRDDRLFHVAGEIRTNTTDRITHIIHRFDHIFFQIKLNRYDGGTIRDIGIDVFNLTQTRHRIFDLARNLGFHLHRCGTFQLCCYRHHGQLNIRRVLHQHCFEARQPDQGEHDEQKY